MASTTSESCATAGRPRRRSRARPACGEEGVNHGEATEYCVAAASCFAEGLSTGESRHHFLNGRHGGPFLAGRRQEGDRR